MEFKIKLNFLNLRAVQMELPTISVQVSCAPADMEMTTS